MAVLLQNERSAAWLMRAVWSLGRPLRRTRVSVPSWMSSLSKGLSISDSSKMKRLLADEANEGELRQGDRRGYASAGAAPLASGEGGDANLTVLKLRGEIGPGKG